MAQLVAAGSSGGGKDWTVRKPSSAPVELSRAVDALEYSAKH